VGEGGEEGRGGAGVGCVSKRNVGILARILKDYS